jgi:hypothetical protein
MPKQSNSSAADNNSPAQPNTSSSLIPTNLWALANAAQNLNQLSDQLTEQVVEIENSLNRLNLGVRATVDVETISQSEFAVHVLRLGYGKVDGKWGLTIDQFMDDDPENTYEVWIFKDAPRDLRLKVIERIPQLLSELVRTSTQLASDINNKITLAKGLVSLLPQPSPSGSKK